jgi:hypothetical protein
MQAGGAPIAEVRATMRFRRVGAFALDATESPPSRAMLSPVMKPKPASLARWRQVMKLFRHGRSFRDAEDGAVTVDWVVLTAAIVGLGVTVMVTVRNGTMNLTDKIAHVLGYHVHVN